MANEIIIAVCYVLLVISFTVVTGSLIAIWLIQRQDKIMFARTCRLLLPRYAGSDTEDFIMPVKDIPSDCDLIPPRMPEAGEEPPPESIPL